MATPYGTQVVQPHQPQIPHQPQHPPNMQQWYDQQHKTGTEEIRSVTPAMNNTRGAYRNGGVPGDPSPAYNRPLAVSTTPGGGANGATTPIEDPRYETRSATPNRYLGAYNSPDNTAMGPKGGPTNQPQTEQHTPSSTGLIRLSLRKPMGIVFEPMYDPNNPSLQRGVRICDLPRTGAAALSRKLEVGDELLSINDKTMSRLTFDEIMDFIIEADPEEVNLLFRRPRKETLQARQGIKKPSQGNTSVVKWVDDDVRHKKKETKGKKESRKSEKKPPRKKDDEDTITSNDEEYRGRSRKKNRSRKSPYESESFLDLLIDTICANPDLACRERRRNDDDYSSDEDGTFASQDDSTYVTYESEDVGKKNRGKGRGNDHDHDRGHSSKRREDSSVDEETEEDTVEEKWKRRRSREKEAARNKSKSSPGKEPKRSKTPENPSKNEERYEDDGTLETLESADRPKSTPEPEIAQPPLGLTPELEPSNVILPQPIHTQAEGGIPAPIKELEYDDRIDHGADVSVMESLGGPSLLIEKQRVAQAAAKITSPSKAVSKEIIASFGKEYPVTFGFTHEQTIQANPLKFYTFVVKGLLEEHEPEKVRLLDKLLAKYKGREDHLVQKLSVRYNKANEDQTPAISEEETPKFTESVQNKENPTTAATVNQTRQMVQKPMEQNFPTEEWPEKETKEPEDGDSVHEEPSHSGSDFSSESIDGTSPAVIAQVSELLNYVYGKTSVPGQIDRVSTIMRAYEGREAVLLELLETKALIKANKEKENTENLPSFLRNSQAMQYMTTEGMSGAANLPPVTPMATQHNVASGTGTVINDDISSMSGVSSPADGQQQQQMIPLVNPATEGENVEISQTAFSDKGPQQEPIEPLPRGKGSSKNLTSSSLDKGDKKKKKGLFGGLFGKKGKKNSNETLRSGSRSRGNRKVKNSRSADVSI